MLRWEKYLRWGKKVASRMKYSIFLIVLGILLCGGVFATDITACGTYSTANSVYDVINDLTINATGTCITVNGANITLDGHGYTITGNYSASNIVGVSFGANGDDSRVKNFNILNVSTGFSSISGQDRLNASNFNITNSKTTGMSIAGNVEYFENISIYNTTGIGITGTGSANYKNIIVYNSSSHGISVVSTGYHTYITNSLVYGNSGTGIYTANGNQQVNITNATVYNNVLDGIMYNGATFTSTSNYIINSTIFNNTRNGIFNNITLEMTITNNHFYNNGKDINFSAIGLTTPNLYTTNNIYDSSSGDYTTYVNASFNDTTTLITTNWAVKIGTQPANFTAQATNYTSFAGKYLNFTSAVADDLDTNPMIVITWQSSEVYPLNPLYHENYFKIFYYTGAWSNTNNGLNITSNSIWQNNSGIQSGNTIFAILQLNDFIAPVVSIKYPTPLNNTVQAGVGNITFSFNATDDTSNLLNNMNCSLYINGVANQTNTSVKNNTPTNFTITNLNNEIDGIYNWSINCTDEWQNQGKNGTYKYDFTIFNISFSGLAMCDSPELNFNVIIPATVINGYFDTIILHILDLNNTELSSQVWNAPDNITNSTSITFPVSVSAGYYRIYATAKNNNSLERNTTTLEIYPQATISVSDWNTIPPANCYEDVYTHSNGQKFYVSSNYKTCPNLGLGQLNSNIFERLDFGTNQVVSLVVYNTTYTHNNKQYSRVFKGAYNTCTTGFMSGGYRFYWKYNLTGSLTHVINLTGINYTSSGTSTGMDMTFNVNLSGTNPQAYTISSVGSGIKKLPDVVCWLNSSGILCLNATTPTVWGTADNVALNQAINFGNNDILSIGYTLAESSSVCATMWQNITISNAFLEKYTGYGDNGLGNYTGVSSNERGSILHNTNIPPPLSQYVNLTLGIPYQNGAYYLSTSPMMNAPPWITASDMAKFSNKTSNSNSNISNPQPTVRILMYYNNQIIYPYLYYAIVVPNKTQSENTLSLSNPNIYLPSTTQINSYNNSIVYVYSREYSSWFLIPPFDLNPAGIYIVNLVYDTGIFGVGINGSNTSGTYTQISAVPELPLLEMCNELNGTYYIVSEYQRTKTFQVNTWYNNTFYANITSAYTLNTQMSTNNLTALEFYVDGFKRCEWIANQTSLTISGVDLRPDVWTTNIFFDVGLILLVGLSAISPAILLPAMAYNDFFQIIGITQMAFLVIFIAIISYITNWYGNRNMKTLLCLVAMGLAMLTYFSIDTGAGYNMQYASSYGNNSINVSLIDQDIKALSVVSQNGIDWNSLAQMVYTGIKLMIDLLAFIIQIPALMIGVLSGLLFDLSPPLATTVSFFAPYLLIGLIGWLVLKAYDMFQKPYTPT